MLYPRTYHDDQSDHKFEPDPRIKALIGKTEPDTSKHTTIKPMLATKTDFEAVADQVFVQPKLDGVRAIWDAEQQALFTRNGRQITSCDHIVDALVAMGCTEHLDGELFCTTLPFQTINGLVNRKQANQACEALEFHVFDFIHNGNTAKRMHWLKLLALTLKQHSPHLPIKTVQTRVTNRGGVAVWFADFVRQGYEGIIIRDPDSAYIQGRTPLLGKIKTAQDMEATLVDFEPTTSKHAGTFGALVLQLPNGKRFNCAGLSDQVRARLWRDKPIGELITFTFEGLSKDGVPRFPRFKAVRHDLGGGVSCLV